MLKTVASLILCFTTSIFMAQNQEISDKELKRFADAYQEIQMANQNSQQEMIKAVENADLTVEKFNEINQAEQNPNQEVKASADDLKKYESAMESVGAIQAQVQQKVESKIKDLGLSMERFQQISALIQNDKELQQRLTALMQG